MRNGKFVGNVKKAASESRYQKNVCLLGRFFGRIYGYASGCKPEAFYLSTATSRSDAQREKKRRVLQVEETSRKSSRKG